MIVGPSARRFLNQYFALPKKLLDCSGSDKRFRVFERSTRMHGSAQVQPHGERCTLVLNSMGQARFAKLTAEDREQPEEWAFKRRTEAQAQAFEAERVLVPPRHDARSWDADFVAFSQ